MEMVQMPDSSIVIDRLRALGCKDEMKIMMAHQTYLELVELDCLEHLTCNYDADLEVVYVTEDHPVSPNVYVPVHSSFYLTPSWIKNVQNKLSTSQPHSIILVIREADSTFVRYNITAALLPARIDCKKIEDTGLRDTSDTEDDARTKKTRKNKFKPGCSKNL